MPEPTPPQDQIQGESLEQVLDDSDFPSKLRTAGDRVDFVKTRSKIVESFAQDNSLTPPEEFENDEHYWYTVLDSYSKTLGINKKHFPSSDKKTLRIASLEAAMAFAQEAVKKDLEKSTDGLTGAWSRRALNNFLEILRAKPRQDSTTGFLLVDIDHFKQINDTKGHPEGDRILKELVALLKDNTRGIDMVARYGGEEFGVVLVGLTNEEIIAQKAEQIREEIAEKLGITISVGASIMKSSDPDIETLYSRADQNLYKAKQNGRNASFDDKGKIQYNNGVRMPTE